MSLGKSCLSCRWHDGFSWTCYNGLSEYRADFTDPEDSCECWEERTEHENQTDEEVADG